MSAVGGAGIDGMTDKIREGLQQMIKAWEETERTEADCYQLILYAGHAIWKAYGDSESEEDLHAILEDWLAMLLDKYPDDERNMNEAFAVASVISFNTRPSKEESADKDSSDEGEETR